jgi:hypothetical protein
MKHRKRLICFDRGTPRADPLQNELLIHRHEFEKEYLSFGFVIGEPSANRQFVQTNRVKTRQKVLVQIAALLRKKLRFFVGKVAPNCGEVAGCVFFAGKVAHICGETSNFWTFYLV